MKRNYIKLSEYAKAENISYDTARKRKQKGYIKTKKINGIDYVDMDKYENSFK